MTRILLNADRIFDQQSFFRELALQTQLPDYFGNNLDALFDFLTIDLAGPVEIAWPRKNGVAEAIQNSLESVRQTLRDAALARADLYFTED